MGGGEKSYVDGLAAGRANAEALKRAARGMKNCMVDGDGLDDVGVEKCWV